MFKRRFSKKGMMDDFFDFFFTVIILFFTIFFINFVLNSNVDSKNDITLDNLKEINTEQLMATYLDYPVVYGGQEIKMRDLILLAVNNENSELFKEQTELFFIALNLEGQIAVIDTNDIDSNPLMQYNTEIFVASRPITLIELPNEGETKSITIIFSVENV